MKNYDFINKITFALCMLLCVACEGTFVLDPIDPRLPKYTETGNNVAGAEINGDFWKSVSKSGFMYADLSHSIAIIPLQDSLSVQFEGVVTYGDVIDLQFNLKGLNIHKFEDLLLLRGKKIALDGVQKAGVFIRNTYDTYKAGIGQIYFKNASINSAGNVITLSGTFGFTVKDGAGKNIEISYGRFDYTFEPAINLDIQ